MSLGVSLAALLLPAEELEAREKRGRLATGIAPLDELLGGGWPRGAISELSGERGSGRTAVLLATLAGALRQGAAVALVDGAGVFDPSAAQRAGVPLGRLLWVQGRVAAHKRLLSAAEAIVAAGGFAVVGIDLGEQPPPIPSAAWLRLRRLAAAPGTAVLVVTARRLQGVLGACALGLRDARARFDQDRPATPPLLLGVQTRAMVARNVGVPQSSQEGGKAGRLFLNSDPDSFPPSHLPVKSPLGS